MQFKKLAAILTEIKAMIDLQQDELRKMRRRMKAPCSKQRILKLKSEQLDNVTSLRHYTALICKTFADDFDGFP